jgi:uncharacterized cupredoxin-like copper-binding protein
LIPKRTLFTAAALLSLAALCVTAIACSDDDSSSSSPTPAATASSASGGGASIAEVKFNAKDFAYDAPATINGGLVKLTMTNTGQEPHQANLLKLNDGVTDAQFQAALQNPDPSGIFAIGKFAGGPNTADPGASVSVTADLAAGKYALLCFISGDDGVPHVAKGMVEALTVNAPTGAKAKEPEAKETYKLTDFAIAGADTLPAGKTTVKVQNDGPQTHELSVLKLDGITFDEAKALITSDEPPPGTSGPPPVSDDGGIGALANGSSGWAELDLTPGTYAFLCFIPDAATGQPHAALGMIKQVTVK